MARFSSLPAELLFHIHKLLDLVDKVRLSATCKAQRSHLSPEIFTTVSFTNHEISAQSALAAVEVHGQHTTGIRFTRHYDRTKGFEILGPLPPAAIKVLGGSLTPNLRRMGLKFTANPNDFQDGDEDRMVTHQDLLGEDSIYCFNDVEDEQMVQRTEENPGWRALMKEVWLSIAENQHVRELIIDDLIPKRTTAFDAPEFQQMLARLESATFRILGMDNGAGWKTNTTDGYLDFLSNLDQPFLRHMTSLKHLHIEASEDAGPLGLEGYRHAPLPLKPKDLPALQSLKLEHCFVGPELVSFIYGHASILKTLDIERCFSGGDSLGLTCGLADNPISWAAFFDRVRDVKPSLTKLVAGGGKVSLTEEEMYGDLLPVGADESEEVKSVREKLKADPNLRLFGYRLLDDKYGMVFESNEANLAMFLDGRDQRAYDRLMELVARNRDKEAIS